MSKIDNYNKQNKIYNQVKDNLYKATGRDALGEINDNNDKAVIRFGGQRIWDTDQTINVHAAYGYYGDSSGYSAIDKETVAYISQALNLMKQDIVEKAIELAKKDAEDARWAAKEEAQNVLNQIGEN